jgi:G:T-mismatch repair DNA endonuclease (very short patch repair protein)
MPDIILRAQAREQNLKHYFTGLPCVRGHIDYRFTSIGKCMACTREDAMRNHVHTTSKRRSYSNQKEFLAAVVDRGYDYSRAVYAGAKTPLEIICPVHGSFWQRPTSHVSGQGCPACAAEASGGRSRKSESAFISEALAVWGERFDYSAVVYAGSHSPVTINCPDHGPFQQTPTNHLFGKLGCSRCNHMKSAPEDAVAKFLSTMTTVVQRDRSVIGPKELDIYLPEHNLAVEYCGMYWHSHGDKEDERKNKRRHAEKHRLCAEKGIRLITLYETEWQERPQTIKRLLRSALGKTRGRLMARKCEMGRPTAQEARAFYEKYHPQGGNGHGEHFGLYHKGKLVACMRFNYGANDRGAGAKDRQWTLSRYATRLSVAGAASRLFKAFVEEYAPAGVKSFSDNRLFSGGMYEQLGFVLEEEVGPDYQVWSPKIGLRPKPHYQRRVLQKRLEEHGRAEVFDASTDKRAESDITYLMGARRIYDCGKKRWVWTAGQS